MRLPGTYISPAETSWYYLTSRYYDPEVGRFLNADAFASTGQGMTGFNMFAYCGNDPANNSDALGIWAIGISLSANLTALLGITGGIGIAFDDKWNFDVQYSYAVPWVDDTMSAGVLDAGAGITVQWVNVETVNDLCGLSSYVGASVGSFYSVGADLISSAPINQMDGKIEGVQIVAGIGIGVDAHINRVNTKSFFPKRKNDVYYKKHTLNEKRMMGR